MNAMVLGRPICRGTELGEMWIPVWFGRLAAWLFADGEIVLALSVAQALERAKVHIESNRPSRALAIYRSVARLEASCVDEEIELARQKLEEVGDTRYPSGRAMHRDRLESKPERDRHLHLYRTIQRGAPDSLPSDETRSRMLYHLREAHRIRPLSGKHLRMMEILSKKGATTHEVGLDGD
ncbi:MAG: hypothetical protein AAFU79_30260 [Myxococcota bacterium]